MDNTGWPGMPILSEPQLRMDALLRHNLSEN